MRLVLIVTIVAATSIFVTLVGGWILAQLSKERSRQDWLAVQDAHRRRYERNPNQPPENQNGNKL